MGFGPPGGTLWFMTESTCPLVCVSVCVFIPHLFSGQMCPEPALSSVLQVWDACE